MLSCPKTVALALLGLLTVGQFPAGQDRSGAMTGDKHKRATLYPHRAPWVTYAGRVVSQSGEPVAKAVVEVGQRTTHTDEKGHFRLTVPSKWGDRHVVNIRKDGFGLVSKIFRGGAEGGLWVMPEATTADIDPTRVNTIVNTRRVPACAGTLRSQVDWTRYEYRKVPRRINDHGQYVGEASAAVKEALAFAEAGTTCNPGIALTIPANSLADGGGNSPTANVTVSVSTVDIYEPGAMPGDFTVDAGTKSGYMVTYGAATVTVGSGGKFYQLKKGAEATLTIPVNAAQKKQVRELPSTIPFLLYDEQQGVWRLAGEAKLDPKREAYVAKVAHFSAFNMDLVKTDQACVRVDSSDIASDYNLEVSFSYLGQAIVRTLSVDNTPEKLHVLYNLPPTTDIGLQALRQVSGQWVPITDTVSVNTGTPQNPSDPNLPAYPYTACNSQAILTERPMAPILSGPPTSTGPFTLSWDYTWTGLASTADGYQLEEESTTPSTTGFRVIYETVNDNDRRTHVDYPITKTTGNYRYRVCAYDEGICEPYSNVVFVQVNTAGTTPTPRTLRIINDLDNRVDSSNIDWGKLNGIIRVRVGTTCSGVIAGQGERMYAGESTTNVADLQVISPAYLQNSSFRDFDVSNVTLAADNTYCVLIQTGWWDTIFDVNTFEFLYYEKRNSMVLNCSGVCCIEKWATIQISQPFFEPEVIRASDFLPYRSWPGHSSCP